MIPTLIQSVGAITQFQVSHFVKMLLFCVETRSRLSAATSAADCLIHTVFFYFNSNPPRLSKTEIIFLINLYASKLSRWHNKANKAPEEVSLYPSTD